METREDTAAAVVILNYNGSSDTIRCLGSLCADPDIDQSALCVVDNASTDDSVNVIEAAYPGVKIMVNGENMGYAGGFNRVIETLLRLGRREFLLLNNDTIVHPGSLHTMLTTLRSCQDIGIVGPTLLDMGTGRIQTIGASINWMKGESKSRFPGMVYDSVSRDVYEVDFVVGCAILVKREVFERVGLFDTTLFMYGEDMDLCLKARKCGFNIVCDSSAVVEHKGEGTIARYPETKARFLTRNRIMMTRRHGAVRHFIVVVLRIFGIEIPYYNFRFLLEKKWRRMAIPLTRGAVEGLIAAIGEPRFPPGSARITPEKQT
jgi:hypothetical protein